MAREDEGQRQGSERVVPSGGGTDARSGGGHPGGGKEARSGEGHWHGEGVPDVDALTGEPVERPSSDPGEETGRIAVARPEDLAAEAEEAAGEDEGEPEPAPESELDTALRERGEYLSLAQRTQADFENFRKRATRDTAAAGERARGGVVKELLPVVDNLERALASANPEEGHLAGGVKLVHSELIGVLSRSGVEQFDPVGERFDPAEHEALTVRAQEGTDPGVVLDVVEKGYRAGEAVLRPARVVVSG
ncbi:MAG: nucleotide exchange factor GrpE [Thermoleophilaceae bacterium]